MAKAKKENEEIEVKEGEMVEKVETTEMSETEKVVRFLEKKELLGEYLRNYTFKKDGYNSHQKYEYVKALQFRTALMECAKKAGIVCTIDTVNTIYQGMTISNSMALTTVIISVKLFDKETGYHEDTMFHSQGCDNLDKGMLKAYVLAIKEYVEIEFGVTDPNEDIDPEKEEEETITVKKNNFVTPEKKKEMVAQITSQNVTDEMVKKVEEQVVKSTTPIQVVNTPKQEEAKEVVDNGEKTTKDMMLLMKELIEKIRTKEENYGQSTLDKINAGLETGEYITKTEATIKLNAIETKYNKIFE